MRNRSHTVLIIAVAYCLLFMGLLGNGLYFISAEGAKLEATKIKISEHTAKESAYSQMIRLQETTKQNRDTLRQFFISESDTISFLANVESAAKEIGVELKTTELAVVPGTTKNGVTTPGTLAVGFMFTGSESAVKKFLLLIEHLPYHLLLPKVTISGAADSGEWSGSTQLRLTLQP